MTIDTAKSETPGVLAQRIRGGRPRDPYLAGRVLRETVELLAEYGVTGLTMDDIAAHAGVGKASIYRRWRTQDELLADAIAELGPRDITWPEPGSLTDDLVALLLATVSGARGRALAAVLSAVPHRPQLRDAYINNVSARFAECSAEIRNRAERRGDSPEQGLLAHACLALLLHDSLAFGTPLDEQEVRTVVAAITSRETVAA